MPRPSDTPEVHVDKILPPDWADDLTQDFIATWHRAAKPHGASGTVRRITEELTPQIRAHLGDPERPRARLLALAQRLLRKGTPLPELRRQLEQEAEKLLKPLVTRVEKALDRASQQLVADATLEKEARKLHRIVTRYNWDGGVGTMRDVIEHEACALGTALLAYWLARPHYYRQYVSRREVPAYERPKWDLLRRIEENVAAGQYRHLGVAFDPKTWEKGYDWTKDVYGDLPRRIELPAHVWIRTTATGIEPIEPARARRRARTPSLN
jgi:hypothetical protein